MPVYIEKVEIWSGAIDPSQTHTHRQQNIKLYKVLAESRIFVCLNERIVLTRCYLSHHFERDLS